LSGAFDFAQARLIGLVDEAEAVAVNEFRKVQEVAGGERDTHAA
jgi:hypothetical protein